MKYRHFQKIVRAVTLVSLAFLLAAEPVMVAAKTLEKDPHAETVNLLLKGGDAYLDSASKTIVGSMELLGYLNTIHSTPLNQISESYVSEVIDRALTVAEQSSIALGSVNVMADGIEQLGGTFPVAMNVAEAAGAGIPQEMRDDLSGLGIPIANIDQVSASASDLLSRRQAGIPAGMQSDLLGFGFTQSQIDQLALAVSERGLANDELTTRLAQLRATQDELSDTRTGMVILAVQLLGYQIAARQIDGIAPRSITDDELQALADDELRLLVHAAHLNAMWGSDPSSEIGEGDWWFIEHYAGRAAERLEAVTVESQNRSLTAELFVLYQMKMLAISARTGDAEYAQAELTGLAALLSHHLNATSYYEKRLNPGLAERVWARAISAPPLRESVEWSIPRWVAKNAKLIMQEQINSTTVENLALIIGGFDESNEANNTGGLLIVAGLSFFDQIEASVVTAAVQIISSATPENTKLWLVAILTGDTDNPALLTANVVLSLIPVIGVIPDLATLAVDPSIFVKALSIFGIIGSIGDILALIPGLQGVGGASFVGDAVATVVKTLFKQADGVFRAVLNGLKLADAFDVVADLVKTVVRIVAGSLGGSLSQVINTITNIFTGSRSLWGDFVAFVQRAGASTLLTLGFDEGSALVGRILNLGVDLSDEALVAVDNVGDKIVKAGVELSDEGMDGVGVLAKNLDPEDVTKFSDELLAICSAAGSASGHAKLARPLFRANSDCVNRVTKFIGELDPAAEAGLKKLSSSLYIGGDKMAALAKRYSENGLQDAFKKTLALSSNTNFASWTSKASSETLDKLVSRVAKENGEEFSRNLLGRLCQTNCADAMFDKQFGRILNRIDKDKVLYSLMSDSNLNQDTYNGIVTLLRNVENPKGLYYYMYGWEFQLERVKTHGLNLYSVEEAVILDNGKQAAYDYTLKNFQDLGETIGEAKYWRRTTIQDKAGSIVNQLSNRSTANKPILLELGITKENPISGPQDKVVTDLIKLIEDQVKTMTVKILGYDSTGTTVQILLSPK